jgi:PERQ amino acid-rich with GYF domain-containing protein
MVDGSQIFSTCELRVFTHNSPHRIFRNSPTPVQQLTLSMATSAMHFGPEWMRPKHQTSTKTQAPPSPPPTNVPQSASTYSALVSAPPAPQNDQRDDSHPFRYSKEELLRIFREGGGKGGLGLEVERWEGVVREVGNDPVGLREMSENEKKVGLL